MRQLNFVFAIVLLLGSISCNKEKDDIEIKLKSGYYSGSFRYDNNQLWESFLIQNDSFFELASGGMYFQKFPEICMTKGTYEIIGDSIYFINVQVAEPPNANIMDYDPEEEGPWDLIVMSETIYYLGWLYSFFDVSWLASRLHAATRPGGQLLLANTQGDAGEPLLLSWIIRTYRDLFLNVGYELRSEEIFRAQKNGVDLEVLISLFCKTI